jgi:hypothetical protein
MLRQLHRRQNLSLILSVLELAGISTPQAQADALGNIATARKLSRMLIGGNVPSMFARGAEHAFGLKRGWMDLPHNAPPPLPARLAVVAVEPTSAAESLPPSACEEADVPA